MTRFWPTLGIACLLALAGYGLLNAMNGRMVDMQGLWLGNLPLENADDCRIRLFPSGDFDLICRGEPTYVAKGKWKQSDDTLGFRFTLFTKDKKQSDPPPEPWQFSVRPGRNQMELGFPNERGSSYRWRRGEP